VAVVLPTGCVGTMDHEVEYLLRRELRELRMARRARSPRARIVHRDLANIYASRRVAISPPISVDPSRWAAFGAFLRNLWPRARSGEVPVDEVPESA
jgi:hypothetical protein